MKLTLEVYPAAHRVGVVEYHALASGDVYNPLEVDLSGLSAGELSAVDAATFSVVLSRPSDGTTLCSATRFESSPGHPAVLRSSMRVASEAVDLWFSEAASWSVSVTCVVSDASRVYASCDVPFILRPSTSASSDFYTKAETDALLAERQAALSVSGDAPCLFDGKELSFRLASRGIVGSVTTTVVEPSDMSGWSATPVVDGVPYYRSYGLAGASAGLARSDAAKTDSMRPCAVVDGVPYYDVPPSADVGVPGLVSGSSSDVSGMARSPVVGGAVYYRDTTYGLASYGVPGLVSPAVADAESPAGLEPCPFVGGAPYYRNTDTTYGPAGDGVLGLVKSGVSVATVNGYEPCPVVDGVPYYRNVDTTYGLASYGVPGLVKAPEYNMNSEARMAMIGGDGFLYTWYPPIVGDSSGYAGLVRDPTDTTGWPQVQVKIREGYSLCPNVKGHLFYRDTTYAVASHDTPGLLTTTSSVTDVADYEPCPVVSGVPYFFRSPTVGEYVPDGFDVRNYVRSAVKDGAVYTRKESVGLAQSVEGTATGLIDGEASYDAVRDELSHVMDNYTFVPCLVKDGVVYSNATPIWGKDYPGLVKTTLDVLDTEPSSDEYGKCVVYDAELYYGRPPLASEGTPGLVKTTSAVTDVDGYLPCPIVDAVPYYREPPVDVAAVAVSVVPKLPVASSVTGNAGKVSPTKVPGVNVDCAPYEESPVVGGRVYFERCGPVSPTNNDIKKYWSKSDRFSLLGNAPGLLKPNPLDMQKIGCFTKCVTYSGYAYYWADPNMYPVLGVTDSSGNLYAYDPDQPILSLTGPFAGADNVVSLVVSSETTTSTSVVFPILGYYNGEFSPGSDKGSYRMSRRIRLFLTVEPSEKAGLEVTVDKGYNKCFIDRSAVFVKVAESVSSAVASFSTSASTLAAAVSALRDLVEKYPEFGTTDDVSAAVSDTRRVASGLKDAMNSVVAAAASAASAASAVASLVDPASSPSLSDRVAAVTSAVEAVTKSSVSAQTGLSDLDDSLDRLADSSSVSTRELTTYAAEFASAVSSAVSAVADAETGVVTASNVVAAAADDLVSALGDSSNPFSTIARSTTETLYYLFESVEIAPNKFFVSRRRLTEAEAS